MGEREYRICMLKQIMILIKEEKSNQEIPSICPEYLM